MKFIPVLLAALLLQVLSSHSSLVLETTKKRSLLQYYCDKLTFEEETFIPCICPQGIWAFNTAPSALNGDSSWKVLGGDSSGQCQWTRLGHWVTRIRRISNTLTKSSIRQLEPNLFLVTNRGSWGLKTRDGRRYCLSDPGEHSYCIYPLESPGLVEESSFTFGCKKNSSRIRARECGRFGLETVSPSSCGAHNSTQLRFQSPLLKRRVERVKREEPSGGPATSKQIELEEDFSDPAVRARFTGDEQVTDSIADYSKTAASGMLELTSSNKAGGKTSTPVQGLLEFTTHVAKVTCPVISEDTFTIAMNSFIVQQNVRNHIKEPYVGYPAYLRMVRALEKCRDDARAHDFLEKDRANASCTKKSKLTPASGSAISRSGFNLTLPDIPQFAVANPMRFEPLVEMVWKMFLITHSYCYRYFSDYFNDHHAFTVAVIPYFSNKIQNTWFIKEGHSRSREEIEALDFLPEEKPEAPDSTLVTEPKYETNWIWYGNLLGDTAKLFESIDRCYLASRIVSDEHPTYMYPWFMNRPSRDRSNEWRRKRRSTRSSTVRRGDCGAPF